MNTPRPQTQPPQMESNPLQRALDNYLVMEMERDAARNEAAEVRIQNAKLVAEVGILRERLEDTEAERRKWETAAATLLGRLLSINDSIAGAVRQAARDGLEALHQKEETKEEVFAADGGLAAPVQSRDGVEVTKTAPEAQTSQAPPQRVLAAVPKNEFRR